MHVVTIPARQGHPFPKTAYRAKGPFPQEIHQSTEIQFNSLEPEEPAGSTAQNGWSEVEFFRCSLCGDVVPETHIEDHDCA